MSPYRFLDDETILGASKSLSLGLSRQTLDSLHALNEFIGPSDPRRALKTLALVGQRRRFIPPGPPPRDDGPTSVFQSDRLPPEGLRRLLVRLLGRSQDHVVDSAPMIAHQLARHGLVLHPFDLPLLDHFVSTHAEVLGPYAVAWARRGKPASENPEITEDNWMAAKPAAKARFIEALRARDPEEARIFLASALPTLPSSVRAELISKLEVGLSALDIPFLEEAAKDRAATVKQSAMRLLGRIPNTAAHKARLSDATSRLRVVRAGAKAAVTLEAPANIHPSEIQAWALNHFSGIRLGALAEQLALTPGELISAAADDKSATTMLLLLATEVRQFEQVAILAVHAPYAWDELISDRHPAILRLDSEGRQKWIVAALHPASLSHLLSFGVVGRLAYFLKAHLPDLIAEAFLNSRHWNERKRAPAKDGLDGILIASTLTVIAALVPPGLRQRLRADLQMEEVPTMASRALLTLDVLDAIEAA